MCKTDPRDALGGPMSTTPESWILGIDVAKATFHVSLRRPDGTRRSKRFDNEGAGHTALLAWFPRDGAPRVHACLEATGRYGEPIAAALFDAGHDVSLVNPAATRAFAKSQLRRTKTDAVDAAVIADFCAAQRPPLW